jgi:hypothetical protein
MIGSSLVLAGALAVSQANGPSAEDPRPPNLRRAVPLGTLDIPDEIAPAIVPYMQCLYSSRGIQMRRGAEVLAPAVPEGTDCSSRRQEAARNADRTLRNQGRGTRAERATYVEAVLASVDRFVSSMPELGTLLSDPAGKPIGPSEDQSHAPD